MKKVFVFIIVACFFCSCIQEFIPQGIKDVRGILVVDGMIRNGESVFRFGYSVGMSDTLDNRNAINNAEVYVEVNDGTRIPAIFTGNGTYIAETPVLDAQKKYRLTALIEGELCESEFLAPVITTAEIDSIFPEKKEGRDEPVNIYIAAHDPLNRSMYYRWTYHETWEVKASFYADARWAPNGIDVIRHSMFTSENTYYCWGRDSSKTVLLASTEKLSENRIAQQPLVRIPSDHDKLSILYHIEVEQMQLRESAYKYFANIKELADRSGDMFAPVLTTGIRGNIHFRNDPDRMVVGYIEVATVTSMDRYIWEKEGFYNPPIQLCNYLKMSGREIREWSYYIGEIFIYGETKMLEPARFCIDCRLKENASKSKPEGWPTNRL